MNAAGRTAAALPVACGLLIALILLLDLSVPLGVAIGVVYCAVVLISLWSPRKRFTVLVAVTCSALTVGAYLYQPAAPEMWKVVFNRAISLFAIWATALLGLQRKTAEHRRERALLEREKALEDLRVLRGLLPICCSCKRIRDDRGYWVQIERYVSEHSEAEFSHGLCQQCAKKLYPEFSEELGL